MIWLYLVVSLPTSAGKTRIAEMCILRALAGEKRVVYVTPLRALSAQVERDLRETFQPLGYSVSSLYGASGEVGLDSDTLANRDIVVATPEKFDFAVRQNAALLDNVGLIVLDAAAARTCIAQYLAHVPPGHRQSAICKLLEICLNQKLSSHGDEYWNPILYPSRNIEVQDVARIIESRVNSGQRKLAPGF